MDDHLLLRYSRHILLDEIGLEGTAETSRPQPCWQSAAAGWRRGCPAYLAASGIGTLLIADGDKIDETNLQRQVCFRETDAERPEKRKP